MAMFDQQPMGPVPARRPILMPPDPEREALMSDHEPAEVTLVGPIPMELVEPLRGRQPGTRPWRWLRWLVALLLVVPTIFNLVAAVGYLFGDCPDGVLVRPARMVAAVIIAGVLVVAHLLFLGSRRRRAHG